MRRPHSAILMLAATALAAAPALAHHSLSMFDTSTEILIEGTIARFDWVNPHMYLIVETEGPDGESVQIQGEGLAITQAVVNGLKREALEPGASVVVRANPNRGGFGKTVRVLDVATTDGEIHPFYAANVKERTLTPAQSLDGKWAASLQAQAAAFAAGRSWKYTEAGLAANKQGVPNGVCGLEPVPFLGMLNELRMIDVGDDAVVITYDNTGDFAERTIFLNAEHPANIKPSMFGHSIGHWEGETLVVDTVAYAPDPWGLFSRAWSSEAKHTVERLTLTEDRRQIRYEWLIEDPVNLVEPVSFTILWDHRPDLDPSTAAEACDPEVAERFLYD